MRPFVNLDKKRNDLAHWDGGPDSRNLWLRNCKKEGADWYYYDKNEEHISYIRNEFGFRERPVAEIDWSNSIVMFGCSVVEGIGNTLEDTIGKNLEKILDIPVLNFGVSGSAVDLACVNSLILHNDYPRPKAIIQMWTGLSRYTDFISDKDSNGYYPNSPEYNPRFSWDQRNKFYVEADRTLWKDKIIYCEGSTFPDTARILDVTFFDEMDVSRDKDHPGYRTNKSIAEHFAKELKEKGL